MKIKAKQHIPSFCDFEEPEECLVSSTKELLETDWIKEYSEWKEFNNFCISKNKKLLMIENTDGTWWWVVATITGELDLPIVRMVNNDQ